MPKSGGVSEQFWNRWREEYHANINLRQRLYAPRRNMQVGDIVIVKKEEIPRNEWKCARILEVCMDDDVLVQKVTI